ncbi:MAG: guanylate kinase [Candidatus Sumerlaeaceae bacterium]
MPISLKPQGILIILSSPSGGGKSSICKALLDADTRLCYSVSVTSRPRRGHEVDGHDYHFVGEDEFNHLIAGESFYEWARVHGNFYGTRRDLVDARLEGGMDVVLDLDVQGGLNIKKLNDKAVLIFVLPPSLRVLEERLRNRDTDNDAIIQTRMRNARLEIPFAQKYDYAVVNEDLEQTIGIIRKIIDAERHSSNHQTIVMSGEDTL